MKKSKIYSSLLVSTLTFVSSGCSTFYNNTQSNLHRQISSIEDTSNLVTFVDTSTLSSENIQLKVFNLDQDLGSFTHELEKFRTFYKENKKQNKSAVLNQYVISKEMIKPYNQFDSSDKALDLTAKKILALAQDYQNSKSETKKYQIKQLTQAIYSRYTPPIRTEYELLEAPIILLKQFTYPTVDVNNVLMHDQLPEEISREFLDNSNTQTNLYSLNQFPVDRENCTYSKAKYGYGVHGGFQIQCGEDTFKVKFGNEIYSGPFNSRIYARIGYTAPVINYFENLKIKYDRRIFSEYNARAAMTFKVTLAYQKIYEFTNKRTFNAFSEVQSFILNDGTTLSSNEVQKKLIINSQDELNYSDANINTDFEKNIAYVILKPATLTQKNNADLVEVGPWKASDLNYSKLSEVRGIMVLSAWVGNYDVRKDNLRVFLKNPKSDQPEIKVGFADAGSGLGHATLGIKHISSSEIEKMAWEVSSRYKASGVDLSESDRVQLTGLMSVEASSHFQNMNLNDAVLMLKRICQISKSNLQEALVASGMSSAEVVLATEKLLNRRNKMLVDFEANEELKKSCFLSTNTKLNYDPKKDGLISITTAYGTKVTAPDRGKTISNGSLK